MHFKKTLHLMCLCPGSLFLLKTYSFLVNGLALFGTVGTPLESLVEVPLKCSGIKNMKV